MNSETIALVTTADCSPSCKGFNDVDELDGICMALMPENKDGPLAVAVAVAVAVVAPSMLCGL